MTKGIYQLPDNRRGLILNITSF